MESRLSFKIFSTLTEKPIHLHNEIANILDDEMKLTQAIILRDNLSDLKLRSIGLIVCRSLPPFEILY